MATKDDIDRIKKMLSPEQRQIAETLATLKVEKDMYATQVKVLARDYSELWRVFVAILDSWPNKELRIHKSQIERVLIDEYRVDRQFDKESEEWVFKLLHIRDPLPGETVH